MIRPSRNSSATPSRRFQCAHPNCRRTFPKAEHLARHERSHSGSKPFSCPVCQRRFARNDSMLRHLKLHDVSHSGPLTSSVSATVLDRYQPIPVSQPELQDSDGGPALLDNPTSGDLPLPLSHPTVEQQSLNGFNGHSEGIPCTGTVDQSRGTGTQHDARNINNNEFMNDVDDLDVGFDWTLSSEDLFASLRADCPTMMPLTLPITQYSPETQTSITYDTMGDLKSNRTNESRDASRHAVQSMSQIIKDLPSKLVAELERGDIGTSFFDDCLDLFFSQFSTSFPVLHKSTFATRECSSTLLLNMLALGSLFIGSKVAIARGESLWSLAHAVVATSWQALMSQRGSRDKCDGVQLVLTAALGQTYALLSKNTNFRITSQIFHGLGFYWSRHCGMYDVGDFPRYSIPSVDDEPLKKFEAWRAWAASETRLRAMLGHYILDGQIAHFSGHVTCVRHASNPLPLPSTSQAFEAVSPDAWIAEMEAAEVHGITFCDLILALFRSDHAVIGKIMPDLGLRVVIESLQSLVFEEAESHNAIGTPTRLEISNALLQLYRWQICRSPNMAELSLRWHSVCLSMTFDIGTLCRQISTGCNMQQSLFSPPTRPPRARSLDVSTWINGTDARRALLHAFAIQDVVQTLPFGRSHAIFLPAAIFAAASVHAAYMLSGIQSVTVPDAVDWDTVWKDKHDTGMGLASAPIEISSVETKAFLNKTFSPDNPRILSRKMSSELHALRMQLKSMASQWGVSQQMDKIMELWHNALRQ